MKGKHALIANIIRTVATLVFLGFVFVNAHWSVFAVLVLITIAVETCAAVLGINMREIQAVRQLQKKHKEDFDAFVYAINHQAQTFQSQMKEKANRCQECELHGSMGIRPGSVHNKNASNCLLKPNGISTI